MPKLRIYTTESIILRSIPLGEADRLLTLFSPNLGKLKVTARGARRITSKLGGHIDPLTCSSLTIVNGKTIDTITSADTLDAFLPLKNSLNLISEGLYLAELVDSLNPLEAPNLATYNLLLLGLKQFSNTSSPILLRHYLEVHLLKSSGFLPELNVCTECRLNLTPGNHLFSPRSGGTLCLKCAGSYEDATRISIDAIKVIRYLLSTTITLATRLNVSEQLELEITNLIRRFLQHTLEKEIRSFTFLNLVYHKKPYKTTSSIRI